MSYGEPGPYPPPTGPTAPLGPPPRRGRPWWVWALGGCGGCALLSVVLSIVLGSWAVSSFQGAMNEAGPVDPASLQQRIGQDVPLYPGSQVEPTVTRTTSGVLRLTEKAAGKAPGSLFKGAAALITQDMPEKVVAFYDKTLKANGWQVAETRRTRGDQHAYQKGREMVIIQAREQPGQGTMVLIMRGGPEIASQAPPSQ
jgi:hypothetical protein